MLFFFCFSNKMSFQHVKDDVLKVVLSVLFL